MKTDIIKKFRNKKVLVIGDVMLDKYIWGSVERISPEAPVQIVHVKRESYVPGGASNVANNLAALGAKVTLIGIVGDDQAHILLREELKKRDIIPRLVMEKRPTIQKVRVLAQNQQLLRIDYETREYIDEHVEKEIMGIINGEDAEIIIVSDYAKGAITPYLMGQLVALSKKKKIPLIVDPKPKHKEYYRDATILTPNLKEAQEMAKIFGSATKDIDTIGKKLVSELHTNLLLTQGKDGMTLFTTKGKVTHIPTKAKEVYDVSGAGDTVVAGLALAIVAGASLEDAATIANHAAGIVVGKVGTATVSVEELMQSLKE